jgi:hypothetical protein
MARRIGWRQDLEGPIDSAAGMPDVAAQVVQSEIDAVGRSRPFDAQQAPLIGGRIGRGGAAPAEHQHGNRGNNPYDGLHGEQSRNALYYSKIAQTKAERERDHPGMLSRSVASLP